MCGLIALVALQNPRLKVDTLNRLDQGLEQIKHRGPDSQGKWISPTGRIGPLHRALSVDDGANTVMFSSWACSSQDQ